MNNYDYPVGSDIPEAPWNREEQPELKFDIMVSNVLNRETSLWSNNYTQDMENFFYLQNPDTEYKEGYTSLLDIVDFAKKAAEYMVKTGNYKVENASTLYNIINSCDGWSEEDFNAKQI